MMMYVATIATPLTCNGGKLSKIKHWAGVRPLEKKTKIDTKVCFAYCVMSVEKKGFCWSST